MKEVRDTISTILKVELSSVYFTDKERLGVASGFVRNGGYYSLSFNNNSSFKVKTTISNACRLIFNIFKKDLKISNTDILYAKNKSFGEHQVYKIKAVGDLDKLAEDLEIVKDLQISPLNIMLTPDYIKGFIAGCYLGSGSMSNPLKSYFLEISFGTIEEADQIKETLNNLYKYVEGVSEYHFKTVVRREKGILYLKRSEDISNFLAYLGATETMLEFENVRIEKDFFNSDNRLNNCDSQNFQRSQQKAKENLDIINKVLSFKKLDTFDNKTQAIISCRLENPDISYNEIVDILQSKGYRISKSSVSETFTKLKQLAENNLGKDSV